MFKCEFPNCEYTTKFRSKIDFHHVIPKELNKNSKLTICLCKNHHALIFHPDSKHGQHSIKTNDSLIILHTYKSTVGKAILYEDMNNKRFFYFPDTKEICND
jgi:hypothetical protein